MIHALHLICTQMLFNHGYIGDSKKKLTTKVYMCVVMNQEKNMVGNEACAHVSLHVIKLRMESESA